jgi:hypothetical protein
MHGCRQFPPFRSASDRLLAIFRFQGIVVVGEGAGRATMPEIEIDH